MPTAPTWTRWRRRRRSVPRRPGWRSAVGTRSCPARPHENLDRLASPGRQQTVKIGGAPGDLVQEVAVATQRHPQLLGVVLVGALPAGQFVTLPVQRVGQRLHGVVDEGVRLLGGGLRVVDELQLYVAPPVAVLVSLVVGPEPRHRRGGRV